MKTGPFGFVIICLFLTARACLASPLDGIEIFGIRPDFYRLSVIKAELGIQPSGVVAKPYRTIHGAIPANFAQWSPNGRFIAITSSRHSMAVNGKSISQTNSDWVDPIQIWDVSTGDKVATLKPEGTYEESSALAWSPDGRFFAACTGSWDANAIIWDAKTWKIVGEIPWPKGPSSCSSISFSPDSKELALGLSGVIADNRIVFYSTDSWKQIQKIKIHQADMKVNGPIRFAFVPHTNSPVSDLVAAETTQVPGRLFLITLQNSGSPQNEKLVSANSWIAYRSTMITQFAMSHHGMQFATGTLNGNINHYKGLPQIHSVRLWSTENGSKIASPLDGLDEKSGFVHGLAYTFGDKYLAVGYAGITGTINLIDPATFKIADVLHVNAPVEAVVADPVAPLFAVTTSNGYLMVWRLR